MSLRRGAALAIALAFSAVRAHAQEEARPVDAIEAPFDATPAIGSGPYRYQLTLRNDEGEAQPRRPFALSLNNGDLPFVTEDKDVWRGMTDAHGRTPVFALPDKIKAQDIFLRPRLGDGPLGEQMQFTASGDGQPLAMSYRLVLCTTPPQQFVGKAGRDGFTAYAASSAPVRILLYALDDEAVFSGRDGDLFWTDDTDPGVAPLNRQTTKDRAKQLRANRKACRKA